MLNKHWVIYTAIWIKNKSKQILKEREDNISTSCIEITLYKIMFDSETGSSYTRIWRSAIHLLF